MRRHEPDAAEAAAPTRDEPLVKRALKEELLKPRYRDAIGPIVSAVLLEQGLAAQLCNSLYDHEEQLARRRRPEAGGKARASSRASASPLPDPEPAGEELSVIRELRERWAAQLHATLLHHCEETGQALMRLTDHGAPSLVSKARSARGCKWLFTADDVIALLEAAQHPNHVKARGGTRSWCLTPLELATSKLPQLREKFAELAPTERQSGLDDELRGWFADERCAHAARRVRRSRCARPPPAPLSVAFPLARSPSHSLARPLARCSPAPRTFADAIGKRLLGKGYAPLLAQFARQGSPAGLRGRVWLAALRLGHTSGTQCGHISERDYNYFGALQREIARVALATDEMVRKDAAASFHRLLPQLTPPFHTFPHRCARTRPRPRARRTTLSSPTSSRRSSSPSAATRSSRGARASPSRSR